MGFAVDWPVFSTSQWICRLCEGKLHVKLHAVGLDNVYWRQFHNANEIHYMKLHQCHRAHRKSHNNSLNRSPIQWPLPKINLNMKEIINECYLICIAGWFYLNPEHWIKIIDDNVTIFHMPSRIFHPFCRIQWWPFQWWRWYQLIQL